MLLEDVLSLRLSFRVSSNFRWIAMFPGRAQHNTVGVCDATRQAQPEPQMPG
jgi:hypothetical protein